MYRKKMTDVEKVASMLGVNHEFLSKALWHYQIPIGYNERLHSFHTSFSEINRIIKEAPDELVISYLAEDEYDDNTVYYKHKSPEHYRGKLKPEHGEYERTVNSRTF